MYDARPCINKQLVGVVKAGGNLGCYEIVEKVEGLKPWTSGEKNSSRLKTLLEGIPRVRTPESRGLEMKRTR